MIKYFYSCVLILLLWSQHLAAQQPITLTIPTSANGDKGVNQYVETLLNHIFDAQGYSLTIIHNNIPSNKVRTAKLIGQNKSIDLFWANAKTDINPELHAIKYPIYHGHIGYRLLLVSKKDFVDFSKITTVEQLAKYAAVQKKDWLDYEILVSNGLKVNGNLSFTAMFKTVEQGLADYFPRSILEIERELATFGSEKLKIEPNLLIKYPSASYFYVNKQNTKLAKIIQRGFQAIIDNGVYDKHFNDYFGETIRRQKLADRQVIELDNPFFLK